VIAKMMARNPAHRYANPNDAAEALGPWAVPVAGFPEDVFRRYRVAHEAEKAQAKLSGADGSVRIPGSSIHRPTPRIARFDPNATLKLTEAAENGSPTLRFTIGETPKRIGAPPRIVHTPLPLIPLVAQETSAFETLVGGPRVPTVGPRRVRILAALAVVLMILVFTVGYLLWPLLN